MNEDTKKYFEESEGEGIDDDNFTDSGSGTGFYTGDDIFIVPIFDNSQSNYQPQDFKLPDFEESEVDFESPTFDLNNLVTSGDLGYAELAPNSDFSDFSNSFNPGYLIFDEAYYLEQNPEVVSAASSDPLEHFKTNGVAEDLEYRYVWDFNTRPTIKDYEAFISNSESGTLNNKFLTFNAFGSNAANDKFLIFDADYYLRQNPDIAAVKIDPLLHFSQQGKLENREHRYVLIPKPSTITTSSTVIAEIDGVGDSLTNNSQNPEYSDRYPQAYLTFNRQYYLKENPDVKIAQINPYTHYLTLGIQEGRSPNFYFDSLSTSEQLFLESSIFEPIDNSNSIF